MDLGPRQFTPDNKPATPAANTNPQTTQLAPTGNKRMPQMISTPKGSPLGKRVTHAETTSTGSPQLSASSKRSAQLEPSPKAQSESSESVRAKLRDSLADSLALVSKHPNQAVVDATDTTTKPGSEDPAAIDVDTQANDPKGGSAPHLKPDRQDFQFNYVLLDEDVPFGNNFFVKDELLQGNGLCWVSDLQVQDTQFEETQSAKRPKYVHDANGGNGKSQPSPQDLATRIEAELFKLYAGVNKKYKEKGRSLLFNLKDRNNPELRERVYSGEISPDRLCSMTAEELASKELSQWRIAKAEELAQMVVLPDSSADVRRLVKKTHKGEFQVEFEQDDGASMENAVGVGSLYQFRPSTSEKEAPASSKHKKNVTSEASEHEKRTSQDENLQSGFDTLPDDGADLMQGLMADELKDAEFLPPIVSLDEFMESLDSEPPFDNLPTDSETANTKTDEKENPEVGPNLESKVPGSLDTSLSKPENLKLKYTQLDSDLKSDDIDYQTEHSAAASIQVLKPSHTQLESIKSTIIGTSTEEHVWEGLLQLNVSSMVTVTGKYKSGEKTSAKEWASFLDVKGRVRLDAFEKFLQELPMSRSRAVMIIHFCWKEGSPESGRVNLCEVVETYVADERVGFAEPAPGVELYLCPPHVKISEILGKHLSRDHIETLNAVNDGLIGIVVWRKVHVTSAVSPNSSSHSKHNMRKQHHSSLRRHQEERNDTNPRGRGSLNPEAPLDDESIDDIPPGFGPASADGRDEDDLPEFDFSRGPNTAVTHFSATNPPMGSIKSPALVRPVEQMRELIHKYGRGEGASGHNGVDDDDDDDDIPEWQPQSLNKPPMAPPPPAPQHLPPPPFATTPPVPVSQLLQNFQPPGFPGQMINQPVQLFVHPNPIPVQYMQPVNVVMQGQQIGNNPWQQGVGWQHQFAARGPSPAQVSGMMPNIGGGQMYANLNGAEWRADVNKSRGF